MFRFIVAFSLLVGALSGGKLSRLGEIKLARIWWIAASFLIKFLPVFFLARILSPSPVMCMLLSLATYLMLFYGLYPNLRLPGFALLASGMFLNFVVIAVNQGRMPVDSTGIGPNLLKSQVEALAASFTHQMVHDGVRLGFLADIFGWRFFSSNPTTFSIGDVLMAAGILWFILHVMHRGFPNPQKDARIS